MHFTSSRAGISGAGAPCIHRRGYQTTKVITRSSQHQETEIQRHPHHLHLSEISLQTGSKRPLLLDGRSSDDEAPSTSRSPGAVQLSNATSALKGLFLPRGWPNSVTTDYLMYQYCTFPSHVTGWMSHALAGSSMLKALGIGMGPAGAVGYTAAIKWVTKDGLGAIGRMVVGGGLSSKFDEDPRRWRMLAELITSTGLALEIATQVFPVNFILLAGTGNLCKAIGRGMGRPCFRVIQTHFSASNNVGDVAAKEEVWEVTAQLIGLAASVALLTAVEMAGTPEAVVPLWAGIHATHVTLRYYSLKALRFPYPNMKRAAVMVSAHVSGQPVPDVEAGNVGEPIWVGPGSCTPLVELGCTVEHAVQGWTAWSSNDPKNSTNGASSDIDDDHSSTSTSVVETLLDIYSEEQYMLTWRDGAGCIVLWQDARPVDMMCALWQAAWLEHQSISTASRDDLKASVAAARDRFPLFCKEAEVKGWDLSRTVLPVGPIRLQKI